MDTPESGTHNPPDPQTIPGFITSSQQPQNKHLKSNKEPFSAALLHRLDSWLSEDEGSNREASRWHSAVRRRPPPLALCTERAATEP